MRFITALAVGLVLLSNTSHADHEKQLVLGLYLYSNPQNQTSYEELKQISESPFDLVLNYVINLATLDDIRKYLDEANRVNLKVIYSLKDFYEGSQWFPGRVGPFVGETEMLKGVVSTFKDHPAVWGWYLADEPVDNGLVSRLEGHYKTVKSIDTEKPVLIVEYKVGQLAKIIQNTDVIGIDKYPVPDKPLTIVKKGIQEARRFQKPTFAVIQVFGKGQYAYHRSYIEDGRPPTYEEVRIMSYLALLAGAEGIIYYSYFDLKKLPDLEERWEWLKKLGRELKEIYPTISKQ